MPLNFPHCTCNIVWKWHEIFLIAFSHQITTHQNACGRFWRAVKNVLASPLIFHHSVYQCENTNTHWMKQYVFKQIWMCYSNVCSATFSSHNHHHVKHHYNTVIIYTDCFTLIIMCFKAFRLGSGILCHLSWAHHLLLSWLLPWFRVLFLSKLRNWRRMD